VAQRTQEIGVRMALGASRRAILLLVMQRAIRLVLIGVLIGVVAAFATTHIMRALLYNVSAVDPISFAAALGIMTLVALVATYRPAHGATRIDPLVALRHE